LICAGELGACVARAFCLTILKPEFSMKDEFSYSPLCFEASDEDIREYAYHLYRQSGSVPGRDLDNWLEAIACLKANIPLHRPDTPLHRHVNGPESAGHYVFCTEDTREMVYARACELALMAARANPYVYRGADEPATGKVTEEVTLDRAAAIPAPIPEATFWHPVPGSRLSAHGR
jgi:hypothetical protein